MKRQILLTAIAAIFSSVAIASSVREPIPDNDAGIHVSDLTAQFTIQSNANVSSLEVFVITNTESYQYAQVVKVEKLESIVAPAIVREAPRWCSRVEDSHYLFSHSLVYFDDHPQG